MFFFLGGAGGQGGWRCEKSIFSFFFFWGGVFLVVLSDQCQECAQSFDC